MSELKDFVVYNAPALLARNVTSPDPDDPSKRIVDHTWRVSLKEKLSSLFIFFKTHGLLRSPESLPDVEKVVLKLSDFTELGRRFIMSGAADRWLVSFDRPGSKKKKTDVSYMEKQLAKLTK